jgi:hypothetical protein
MSIDTYINNDIKISTKPHGEKARKDPEMILSTKEVAWEKSCATHFEKGGSSNEKVYLIGAAVRMQFRVCHNHYE